jgi:uncharacterized HAD superfamily protein
MKKPVIFDIDGVLADFSEGFTTLASKMFGVEVTRATDQPTYHWANLTKEQANLVWREVDKSHYFWENLRPLIDQQYFEEIDSLAFERPLYFVTARPDYAKKQTENWLAAWGVSRPTVITTKRKGEFAKAVDAGFCIEDKPSNASMVAWLTEGETKSYLIDRPYNQAPKEFLASQEFLASDVRRIYSVNEYLEAIGG